MALICLSFPQHTPVHRSVQVLRGGGEAQQLAWRFPTSQSRLLTRACSVKHTAARFEQLIQSPGNRVKEKVIDAHWKFIRS